MRRTVLERGNAVTDWSYRLTLHKGGEFIETTLGLYGILAKTRNT